MVDRLRQLNSLAEARGQTLAQLALVWALRDSRVTSVITGASSPDQVSQNVEALASRDLTGEELEQIDRLVTGAVDIDLWRAARNGEVR